MAIAVHETLSAFLTEMREGLAAVKTEMREIKTNLRVMERKVNHLSREIITHKNQSTFGLAMLNSSIEAVKDYIITVMKEDIKAMKGQLNEHRDSVAEELESLLNNQNTFDLKLDLLDSKQDTLDLKQDRLAHRVTVVASALEARILSTTTRELERSAENHVTAIGSQLTSVNTSIRNKLRMMERLIANKWKNHFSEMKGDVGMSCHLMKKKGNKKMPTQRQKVIQPHPYIFVFQCA